MNRITEKPTRCTVWVGCAVWLFALVCLIACGGSGTPSPPPQPSTITSVTIPTNSTSLRSGQSLLFSADVQGTGAFSRAVTWSVNGITGGDPTNGTLSSTGAYTAPAAPPPTNPVTITATSVQDPTKSGSASLTIFTLSISPSSPTVFYNHTQQFTATLTGITNPSLVWQALYGTVDSSGLYTSPSWVMGQNATDTVSVNVKNARSYPVTATITLQIPPPILTSITPNGASANEGVIIDGQDLLGVQQVFFSGPYGTPLRANFRVLSTSQVKTDVPLGTVSGPVYMTLEPIRGVTTTSNSINFTRLSNLRIRANAKDLSSGELVQFTYRVLGATSPTTVDWTTDLGNVSTSGLYQAPVVSQESFATVTGCLQNTRSCDSTMLRIVPLRIAPAIPLVSLGQSLQLDAVEGSPVSANWSVLAGGGSVTPAGLFTAPSNPVQAGGVPVSATAGNANDTASVAVTGAFPGLVSRTYDYLNRGWDSNTQQYLQKMEGTQVRNLAVSGNRAFTLDLGIRANPPADEYPPFTAVEVYDISDPYHPVWLDAAESMSNRASLLSTYGHYLFEVDTGTVPVSYSPPSQIALYDVQSNPPQLVSFASTPDLFSAHDNNGLIYAPALAPYNGSTAPIYVFDVTTGTIQQTEIDLPLPAGALVGGTADPVIGTGSLIYTVFNMQAGGGVIAVYDASGSPPTLLATVPIIGGPFYADSIMIHNNWLFVGNLIYDITNSVPVQVAALPTQIVEDVRGTQLLGRAFQPIYTLPDNDVLVDITDPKNPVTKTSVYDWTDLITFNGKFLGNGSLILTAEGLGGLATTDLSIPGGLIDKARVMVFPDGYIFDHKINQQIMYVAGASGVGGGAGGLMTFDLSSGTPVLSGVLLYQRDVGLAVQVSNGKAFMGLLGSLKTVDVTDPANPAETGSLALPTNALALSGNTLFDGTGDSRLVALDVTNANAPIILGTVLLPASAVNLRLIGNTLFVADGSAGLLIFDVTNPAVPLKLSQLSLSTPVWDVAPSGTLAFVAADSLGLVIVDISNILQPKQISQTTLESWNPFPDILDEGPRSVALSVAVRNGLVYVGTADSLGLVFGFDYSQPNYPRLVSMNAFGEVGDALISGFSFVGNDIYVVGYLGVLDDILQADNSAPRNVIDLYYPPLALRSIGFTAGPSVSGKLGRFVHPKFDRKLFQKQHRYVKGQHMPPRTRIQ